MNLSAWTGLLGILFLLGVAFAMSNNRKAIHWRLVITGIVIQWVIAIFVLKVPAGKALFGWIAKGITQLLSFSDAGASFVFGPLVSQYSRMGELFGPENAMILAFKLVPTIIFVATLVSIAYHIGLMQRLVQGVAWLVSRLMGASGSEALSNAASIFVGQVEAQLLIKPYVPSMTQSELLAVMAGSMACIAGGIMAVYIQMGIPAEYLLAASLMAAPGALVISKIVYPETEVSPTKGTVQIEVGKQTVNLLDAAAHGASDGMRIGIQVIAMLIGFVALIACVDFVFQQIGLGLAHLGLNLSGVGIDLTHLSLRSLLGVAFSGIAFLLGTPWDQAGPVGGLMGTKMVLNEFVAYTDLRAFNTSGAILETSKAMVIASFALCGFANFGSIAIQIGGIGELAPSRKGDLARLGIKALICGTMASYISAAIAGIITSL